jgi:hypothetical protein
MSWFHASMMAADDRNCASAAEIVACFQNEGSLLGKLAFLITGDQATADQSVVNAREITLRGNSPFREWLLEWAKIATITSAISQSLEAIRVCQALYKARPCTHVEHLRQVDAEERESTLNLIIQADVQKLIAALDPLCRAILVLRVAIRSSIQECVLRLNVSRAVLLGANCHTMTWLQEWRTKSLQETTTLRPPKRKWKHE